MTKQDERIAKMTFASIYPHYVTKIEKKGRTKKELHEVIEWLTGYNEDKLHERIETNETFESFFSGATMNKNAHQITGKICGYKVEEIQNSLTQQVRYLDKLVDELAKGWSLEKICRHE
ncbi:DUF2200 domain-containing protein [Flavicella marina]|uniref:DUF2200 domain-containing protein n=1 Tax=Flavicella marina TaxID=1475951 RepID=UPI0012659382|nr:DUF2200 domain-containing protein [Flavicella marina]